MRTENIFLLTLALCAAGCVASPTHTGEEGLSDRCNPDHTPISAVQEPPADEATVMEMVPAIELFNISWSAGSAELPASDLPSTASVEMLRTAEEAVVSTKGALRRTQCVDGNFLLVPYDALVTVGDQDVVATIPMWVQADDSSPPTLQRYMVTDSVSLAEWTPALQDLAKDGLDSTWAITGWTMSHSGWEGSFDLTLGVTFETNGDSGSASVWRGELLESNVSTSETL